MDDGTTAVLALANRAAEPSGRRPLLARQTPPVSEHLIRKQVKPDGARGSTGRGFRRVAAASVTQVEQLDTSVPFMSSEATVPRGPVGHGDSARQVRVPAEFWPFDSEPEELRWRIAATAPSSSCGPAPPPPAHTRARHGCWRGAARGGLAGVLLTSFCEGTGTCAMKPTSPSSPSGSDRPSSSSGWTHQRHTSLTGSYS